MRRSRLFWTLGMAALVLTLAACNRNDSPEPRLEPTRTLAPRPTEAAATAVPDAGTGAGAATATAAPATPQPVTGLTLDNADQLAAAFGIDEPPPQHIYSVGDGRMTLYNVRSFEVVDTTTLDVQARTQVQLRNKNEPGFWYAASPDGRLGAIMQLDGTIDIYDLDSSLIVTTVQVPEPSFEVVSDIALNEDGSQLVVVSQGELRRVDLVAGEVLDGAQALPDGTQAIRFSEDGSRLAAVQPTGEIVIVNALSGAPAITLTDAFTETVVERLNFSPDGSRFGASDRNSLVIWDLSGAEPRVQQRFDELGTSVEPVIDRTGRHLAVIADTSVFLYDLQAQEAKGEYRLSASMPVWSANFDRSGETLFIAGSGDLASFNVVDGQVLESSTRPPLTRATFSPDGTSLATWSATYQSPDVAVVGLDGGDLNRRLLHETPVRWVTYSPDGDHLATLTFGGVLRVWDGSDVAVEISAPPTDTLRAILCFSADGAGVTYLNGDQVITHDIAGDRTSAEFTLPFAPGALSVCTNDQRHIAAADDGKITVFNLEGETVTTLEQPADDVSQVGALYFSRDGTRLAALGPDRLTIWDVATRERLQVISLQRAPLLGLFNPAGDKFALNFGDDVDILDIGSGKIASLDLPKGSAVSMLFPQDPRLIVTTAMIASESTAANAFDERNFVTGELSIWDAQTGELVRSLETDDPIFTATISDDGSRIATSTRQNAMAIWEVP